LTIDKNGVIGIASKFPTLSMDVGSAYTNQILTRKSQYNSRFEYIRINPFIDKNDMRTDCIDPAYLDNLETIARNSIIAGGNEHKDFERVQGILSSNFSVRNYPE
jgi:hypothetical protein